VSIAVGWGWWREGWACSGRLGGERGLRQGSGRWVGIEGEEREARGGRGERGEGRGEREERGEGRGEREEGLVGGGGIGRDGLNWGEKRRGTWVWGGVAVVGVLS